LHILNIQYIFAFQYFNYTLSKTIMAKKRTEPLAEYKAPLTEVEQVEPPVNPVEYGVSTEMANDLMADLPTVKSQRQELLREYDAVMALDPDDSETAVKARELRIAFQKNRTQGILKWHERAKEVFLRGGQFVDAIKRKEIAINETHESELQKIERRQEILEAERKEKIRQDRMIILNELESPEVHGLAEMTQEAFETYVMGIRARKAQEEQQRLEREAQERKDKLHSERYVRLSKYADFIEGFDNLSFGDMDEAEFIRIGSEAKTKKDARDAEQLAIRVENERLRIEAEEKERRRQAEIKAEHDRQEKERVAREAEAKRIQAEADAILEAEREKARIAQMEADKLRKAQEEQEALRLAQELKERQEQEAYEAQIIANQEAIAKQDAFSKLNLWVDKFELPEIPGGGYTSVARGLIEEIHQKHEGFKSWCKNQIKLEKQSQQ
jgi:colicin import membrane protein